MRIDDKIALFDSGLPLDRASTIPGLWYTDAEVYELERRRVFLNSWQAVGRTDQVAEPGQYFTAEVAGERVAVVRDKEGKLRAFTNVCRHRAARVIPAPEGKANFFQCRYHGWTYDLTGRLKGTPEFDGVCEFKKEDNTLPPWHVATWGPLVFVHAGKNPEPLEALMAPVAERGGRALDKLKFTRRNVYDIACNWKIFCDNYLDGGYHVNTLHPSLAGVINYATYRTELHGDASVQVSPLRQRETKMGEIDVTAVRGGDAAYYWWLWPNLMINIYEGVMDTNVVFPLGPDKCRVVFDFYFADTDEKFIADSLAVSHQIQLEDIEISEEVQRGLNSTTYSTGRFSVKRESGGYHFHQLLARELRRS